MRRHASGTKGVRRFVLTEAYGSALSVAPRSDSALLFVALLIVIAIEYGGLGNHIPLLKTIRLTTILSYLIFVLVVARHGIGDLFARPQVRILIALAVLTALSVLWAVVRLYAFQSIRPIVDYIVFLTIVASLIDRPGRARALSWVIAFTCIFLVTTNFAKLMSVERVGPFKAAYFMGDGNDFAWGLVIFLPFILNLIIGDRSWPARFAGILGIACCLIGIIGSGSRGASIGLAASIGFYWLVHSRRKFLGALVICGVLGAVMMFAPTTYFDRMQSVTEFREDSSAQGRLQAWRAAISMAIDHPMGVGAGNFSSAYGRFYKPSAEQTTIGWAAGRWLSAHSIYFRILGEYGVLGLAMLISLVWLNIRDNLRSHRSLISVANAPPISPTWPTLLNMSVIGFAVCGVFLGGLSYPHLFLLTGLTVSCARLAAAGQPLAGALASPGQPVAEQVRTSTNSARKRR